MTFTKHDTGKAPLDFLLQFTGPLEQVCRIAKYGADKYGSLNWRKCEDPNRYKAALLRHLFAAEERDADPDHGFCDYAAVAWCALVLCWFKMRKESQNA